ncbi:MAG: Rieske 2Fe-2S domain-containing protein [Candidatus Omnitrophica bacterium]|nr:Rieske 2Fe-2S domain-containing protein [Candidatus Omnitrophota bacterium]
MAEWCLAGKKSDFTAQSSKLLEAAGKEIAVFHAEGKFFAVSNFCPHRGGPLYQGTLEPGPSVVCPLHGWTFDLEQGGCLNMPNAHVGTFPVEVRGEEVFVQI